MGREEGCHPRPLPVCPSKLPGPAAPEVNRAQETRNWGPLLVSQSDSRCLEEVEAPVCSPQLEDVWFLGIMGGWGSQRVVHSHGLINHLPLWTIVLSLPQGTGLTKRPFQQLPTLPNMRALPGSPLCPSGRR